MRVKNSRSAGILWEKRSQIKISEIISETCKTGICSINLHFRVFLIFHANVCTRITRHKCKKTCAVTKMWIHFVVFVQQVLFWKQQEQVNRLPTVWKSISSECEPVAHLLLTDDWKNITSDFTTERSKTFLKWPFPLQSDKNWNRMKLRTKLDQSLVIFHLNYSRRFSATLWNSKTSLIFSKSTTKWK